MRIPRSAGRRTNDKRLAVQNGFDEGQGCSWHHTGVSASVFTHDVRALAQRFSSSPAI